MMRDYPIHFECKVRKDKPQADLPMYFRIWLDGKNHYLNLKRKIPASMYDAASKRVQNKGRGWRRYQDHIDRERARLIELWDELSHKGYTVSYDLLKKHYTECKPVLSPSEQETQLGSLDTRLADFVNTEIEKEAKEHAVDSSLGMGPATIKKVKSELSRVVRFHPDVTFKEITADWIDGYYA